MNVDSRKCWAGAGVFSLSRAQPDDVVYTAMPLYHSAASLIGVVGTLQAGMSMSFQLHRYKHLMFLLSLPSRGS